MEKMNAYLSEDGRTVIVLQGDSEEQFTVDEFAEIYGEDELPTGNNPEKVVITEEAVEAMASEEERNINAYYDTLKKFLNSIGWHQGFLKVVDKYDNVTTEEEKNRLRAVIEDNYKVPIQFLDQELQSKNSLRQNLFVELNEKAAKIGLSQTPRVKMMETLRFLEEQSRRDSIRGQIKRLQSRGEHVSLDELIEKRKQWEESHKGD